MRARRILLDICPWPEGVSVPSVKGSSSPFAGGSVVLQKALLAASRRPGLRRMVTGNPATRRVVDRFVAGETLDDALAVGRGLDGGRLSITHHHQGGGMTTHPEGQLPPVRLLCPPHGLATHRRGPGSCAPG